ncbi:MAG: YceI family protein [Acidobacteriota bacterium]|nr:YceI family protein [Acidobacteriota bacterium]
MKKMKNLILAITTMAALGAFALVGVWFSPGTAQAQEKTKAGKVNNASVPAGTYNLDPAHSIVGFAVRHFEINWVEGRFKDFTGAINYNEQDATKSTVQFTAKIESTDTGVEQRDSHLRTADFFDAPAYPEMKFASTKIEKKGKDKYILHGDFTLKGLTKQIEFPFTFTGAIKDPWGNIRFGIEAHTKINRRDYGRSYGNALATSGFDVGNEITVDLLLEAVKPDPKTTGAADSK